MDQERAAWLGLASLADILGSRRLTQLIERTGSPVAAWGASASLLRELGCKPDTVTCAVEHRAAFDTAASQVIMERDHIELILQTDSRYPALLTTIPDAPIALFVRGDATLLASRAIAFVGTRKCTQYGEIATRRIVEPLARSGTTITSGLAYGIDAAAHRACLDAGGRTIAVLGTGIDRVSIYPAAHRALAEQIITHGGALVSEYVPGTEGLKMHFPARNRIVAGMSLGTVVVESPPTSGALITARFALDFGREVFAVPGPITSATSAGPHSMLKSGATPVTRAEDIIEALNLDALFSMSTPQSKTYDGLAGRILESIAATPIHIDELQNTVDAAPQDLASALTTLELDGVVRDVGGSKYIKVN
ncbi:MAG: DNA-processing protein DprA [Candidatus Uhrbacteria bacterium]